MYDKQKFMTEMGNRVKAQRERINLSQEELALKVGYKSKSTINKIELGINDIPQSKIIKFAEVLDTSPSALMGWEEMEKKNNAITDIVVRLRNDEDFLYIVESMGKLDTERLKVYAQLLSTLLK